MSFGEKLGKKEQQKHSLKVLSPQDGSAKAGVKYVAAGGCLEFSPGGADGDYGSASLHRPRPTGLIGVRVLLRHAGRSYYGYSNTIIMFFVFICFNQTIWILI